MEVQAHHLSRLIEDLLDVARIDQGKISLKRERVTVQSIIDSAVDTSRPKIDAGRHHLTVDMPGAPIWLDGDFTRLSQVVSNLLTNAAKYTPSEGRIQVSANRVEDRVRIDVADNGVGVPEEMKVRVFDLFTQSKGPDDRSREGLGIGLALVRELVEMHEGAVELESNGPGSGSRFTVWFPVAG